MAIWQRLLRLGGFCHFRSQREEIATEGIDACRQLIAANTNSVPGHYYLAMNLGQLAQTKSLGALKIVRANGERIQNHAGSRPQN